MRQFSFRSSARIEIGSGIHPCKATFVVNANGDFVFRAAGEAIKNLFQRLSCKCMTINNFSWPRN